MKTPTGFDKDTFNECVDMLEKHNWADATMQEFKITLAGMCGSQDLALAIDENVMAPPCDIEDPTCSACWMNNHCNHKHKSEEQRVKDISNYILDEDGYNEEEKEEAEDLCLDEEDFE
jgi:hypothetical protein